MPAACTASLQPNSESDPQNSIPGRLLALLCREHITACAVVRMPVFLHGIIEYCCNAPQCLVAQADAAKAGHASNQPNQRGSAQQQGLQAKEAAAAAAQRAGVLSPGTRAQRTAASPLSPVSSPPRRAPAKGEQDSPRGDAPPNAAAGSSETGLRARPRATAPPSRSGTHSSR